MTNKKNVPLAPPPPTPKNDTSARFAYRFSIPQLAEIFMTTPVTVKKRIGDVQPAPSVGRKAKVYDLRDVTQLIDVRDIGALKGTYNSEDKNAPILLDDEGKPLNDMSPSQMKLYYQGLDMEQSYRTKKLKNDAYERKLIPAEEIELTQAAAFKSVAKFLDNFPDIMERNGLIQKADIPRITNMTDKIRNQLADDMAQLDDGVEGDHNDALADLEEEISRDQE